VHSFSEVAGYGFASTRPTDYGLEKRLATGPLRYDAAVPFFHFYGGKMQKDVFGAA
jgi:hypothetical protein